MCNKIAVSETGQFVAVSSELKVIVFKKTNENSLVELSRFEPSQSSIMGLYISETPQLIVSCGSGRSCQLIATDFGGRLFKTVKSDITNATSVQLEKHSRRFIYNSEAQDIRVFGVELTSKQAFKDLQKEHTMHGHKNSVITCSFDDQNKSFFSLSSDLTLRHWDVAVEGFKDVHIKTVASHPVAKEFVSPDTIMQWCGRNEAKNQEIVCLSSGSDLIFLGIDGTGLEILERVEDAHQEEEIKKLNYYYDQKSRKGILVSQCSKRIFSWKVQVK